MDEYYTRYYTHQIGGSIGGGIYSDDQFQQLKIPRVYQRGRGVGSIFSSLWRFLQPLLKKGATFASKELIENGTDILNGIASQKPLNHIIADQSIKFMDKIRDKATNKIKTMAGAGKKRKLISESIKRKNKKLRQTHSVAHHQPTQNKKLVKKKSKKQTIKTRVLDIFS